MSLILPDGSRTIMLDGFDKPKGVKGMPLQNDELTPEQVEKYFGISTENPTSSNVGNKEHSSNKIDTSNNLNGQMSQAGWPNYPGYNTPRNIGVGFRERTPVDVEGDRGGRLDPRIFVGQHRDSPHHGWTNDFASNPRGYNNFLALYAGQNLSNDSWNTGQQSSGQGSATGAGNYGGPNINISNVNNPQAVANTGTIQDSTISNPSTGESSQTTTDNTNTNTPVVSPIGGGPTPIGGGPTPIGGGPTPIGGGPTPIGGGPTPIGGGPTPIGGGPTPIGGGPVAGGDTRFSTDFETEQDAKDWLNSYYGTNLGRDAQFDDQFSNASTNASYWLNELSQGTSTKDKVGSDILLSTEYTNREAAKDIYGQGLDEWNTGKDLTDTAIGGADNNYLTGVIGPGGGLTQSSDQTASSYFQGTGTLSEYETQYGDLSDRDESIYNLYTEVFGRNPDESGLNYWFDQDTMSLADIEATFKGSPEAKVRDTIGGTSTYENIDDYVADKNAASSSSSSSSGGSSNSGGGSSNTSNSITISPTVSITPTGSSNTSSNNNSSSSNNTETITITPVSQTADSWLEDFYVEHGIGGGNLDEGGKNYWTEQAKTKSIADVKKDIEWAAKHEGTWNT